MVLAWPVARLAALTCTPFIPDLYPAHRATPAAEPATAEYAAAQAGFEQTLAVRLRSWPGRRPVGAGGDVQHRCGRALPVPRSVVGAG